MKIDQLILWLAKLGFKKWESADGPFVPPSEGDYYMVTNAIDGVLGEITVVDVYFDELGSYKDGSISFCIWHDKVISSHFWADDRDLTEDRCVVEKFKSINDLAWHINQFKVNFENLMSKGER